VAQDLTIGDVARRAGVRTSKIRYYEEVGLLPAPPRSSGRRRYDETVLQRLGMIRVAQRAGFRLGEIRVLMDGFAGDVPPPQRWRALATDKLAEVDALIAQAREMRRILEAGLDCRCLRLDDCRVLAAEADAQAM
jgi:MerR family transcriptional regulator, redox-sensitive transcriptional activator SoxR